MGGALAALLAALALHAGSGNCRWRLPAALCRHGKVTGLVLALVSLAAWIAALGVGAGLCAMLGCWMLAMVALPYLPALTAEPARRCGAAPVPASWPASSWPPRRSGWGAGRC